MCAWSGQTIALVEPKGQNQDAELVSSARSWEVIQMTTLVIPPREGKAVSLGGFGAIFKIPAESSEGRFSIVEHPIDPGRMVHPHVDAHEDEFSYILEGEIGARVGDEVLQATTGSYVFKQGAFHTLSGMRPRNRPDCSNSSHRQALKSISPNWPTCCGQAGVSTRLPI